VASGPQLAAALLVQKVRTLSATCCEKTRKTRGGSHPIMAKPSDETTSGEQVRETATPTRCISPRCIAVVDAFLSLTNNIRSDHARPGRNGPFNRQPKPRQ
jgi:hypothetical protein